MTEETQTDGSFVEQVFATKTQTAIIMAFVESENSRLSQAEMRENMSMTNPSNGLQDLLNMGVVIEVGKENTEKQGRDVTKYKLANPSLMTALSRLEGALGATVETRQQTETIVENVLSEMGAEPDGVSS